jgi:hypothetical protein
MRLDFKDVADVEDYTSVPPGHYPCRIAEVREGVSREGEPRWSFRLEVVEGDYAGRTAAWDGLSWGERGLKRAKYILSSFGFDVSGALDLDPNDLLGLSAWVEVENEEREDPTTGHSVVRPKVPFLGYTDANAEGFGGGLPASGA